MENKEILTRAMTLLICKKLGITNDEISNMCIVMKKNDYLLE